MPVVSALYYLLGRSSLHNFRDGIPIVASVTPIPIQLRIVVSNRGDGGDEFDSVADNIKIGFSSLLLVVNVNHYSLYLPFLKKISQMSFDIEVLGQFYI